MNVIGYTESGLIRVIFDGDTGETVVPDDMNNGLRVRIYDEYEFGPPDTDGVRARVNTIPAYVAPPPGPYQIAKRTPWLRMTDDEGALVYAAMSETGARLRAIYDAATYLSSDDPLWATMHDILAATLSEERAIAILAPET